MEKVYFSMCVREILSQYDIDVVLDIGANWGQYGKELREMGYAGEIHSFEPVQEAYNILSATSAKDPRWHCHRLALGAKKEEKLINVMQSAPVFSSFKNPNYYGKQMFHNYITPDAQEMVSVDTVDNFLSNEKFREKNIYMKIDTQGHDLEVFKGSLKSLGNISVIQSELSLKKIYHDTPSYIEALQLFAQYGYEPASMHTITRENTATREKGKMVLVEIDVVLAKPSQSQRESG